MSKVKKQVAVLEALIDPLDTDVSLAGLKEALEKAGATSVTIRSTAMRMVVVPEVGGES